MPTSTRRAPRWPRGWTAALKESWRALGLEVEQARAFDGWGWTPKAALQAARVVGRGQIAELRDYPRPIRPDSDIFDVMTLHRYGVESRSDTWDTVAVDTLAAHGDDEELARRLRGSDDPVLTVLAALHRADPEPPADVALARHADEGCRCEPDRFEAYLGIGPVEPGEPEEVVVMTDVVDTVLEIRTGPYLAARIDGGLWLRLPDLASACWYLRRHAVEQVVTVNGTGTGFRCLIAMARLTEDTDTYEADVDGTVLLWDGATFLPGYDVPDWMVVAEDQWEGSHTSPMDSGGVTYLIESDGEYYFGGDEMGWNQVGPFATGTEARAWFDAEIAPTKIDYSVSSGVDL